MYDVGVDPRTTTSFAAIAVLTLGAVACSDTETARPAIGSDASSDASLDGAPDVAPDASKDGTQADAPADGASEAPLPDADPGDAGGSDVGVDAQDGQVDAAPASCDPGAAGLGLPTLNAPVFTAAVSASTPVFRTLSTHGKMHYPDGAVTIRDTGSGWEVYLSSGRESYRLTGTSPATATLDPVAPVIAPTGNDSEPHQGYAGVTTVTACGGALRAFFHAEYHQIPVTPWSECPAPYHASMARASASPGTTSFQPDAPAWFLTSSGVASYGAPKCAYGAGGGSVFDPGGDYLYLYYYDWDAPNGIYLARSCRDDCGAPGSWRKYQAGAFSTDASASSFLESSGPSSVVVPAGGSAFDAFPVVSRNTYLDAYLMIAATESGYSLRVSADGLVWGPRVEILHHLEAADGRINVYYPTLFDAQTWSRDVTGRHLKLVHAVVADDEGRPAPHRAFVADVELSRQGDQQTVGYDRKTLVRYFNPANPYDHWCTTSTSTGYPVEGNLGMLAANSLPGTRPLYDCVVGGKDHMVSSRSDCEGATTLGIMGFVWIEPGPGRHALYRCSMASPESGVDHLVSVDPGCEGLTHEGLIGYAE